MAPADDTAAAKIRAALDERRLSVRAFAKDFGRDKSQIAKWLNGTVIPSRKNALELARYFDEPDDWLLTPRSVRPGSAQDLAELRAELEALRQEVADLRRQTGHG